MAYLGVLNGTQQQQQTSIPEPKVVYPGVLNTRGGPESLKLLLGWSVRARDFKK